MNRFASASLTLPNGRLLGSSVYMLLCRDDDGPVYVKVGFSDNVLKRLEALLTGCPVTPHQFAYMPLRSRRRALEVEKELHDALLAWRTNGEWFSVPMDERPEFNRAWSERLRAISDAGFVMRWEQIDVADWRKTRVAAINRRRKAWWHATLAVRDAREHGAFPRR